MFSVFSNFLGGCGCYFHKVDEKIETEYIVSFLFSHTVFKWQSQNLNTWNSALQVYDLSVASTRGRGSILPAVENFILKKGRYF